MTRSTPKRKKRANAPKRTVAEASEPQPSSRQPPASTDPLSRLMVGGQLVGNRPELLAGAKNTVPSWDSFEPIITPEVLCEQRKKPERYILMPHSRYITVLAYRTGSKIGTLVPKMKEDAWDDDVVIECVNLVKYQRKVGERTVQDVLDRMDTDDDDEGEEPMATTKTVEETLVMVGCRDGSVREFSLKDLGKPQSHTEKQADLGPFKVPGACFRPRRVIRVLKTDPIMHMTVPHLRTSQVRKDGIVMYITARRREDEEKETSTKRDKAKHASFGIEVLRVLLPHFQESKTDIKLCSYKDSMRSLDKFKSTISLNKKKKFTNTLPFTMVSVASGLSGTTDMATKQNCSIFVVLAKANDITVYYDQLYSSQVFPPMSISMPSNNPLTVASISLNKVDITCGHCRGNIRVLNNILSDIEIYHHAVKSAKQLNGDKKALKALNLPADPRKNIITSRVHWHALPVTSIVYDSMSYPMDPLLYSGGDESVLVTWQISQGRDRPVHVHPRLALGGIIHLSSSDVCDDKPTNGILVYCEDNTLQLLESHNKGLLWKVQGLASAHNESIPASLQTDPRSDGHRNSQLVLTGLAQAPGYIHWFDPVRERLASSLEVVPFNRISKNEPEDRPLPVPSVTGHVFSKNGDDLITVDESQTENVYIGAKEDPLKGDEYGTVSTIRFWKWNDTSSVKGDSTPPYHEIASMTYPHGPKNRISAIDMSQDGTYACTISCSEKAFRVWQKSQSGKSMSWACRYKVKIPAGFSNCPTTRNGLTFSDDNSLLVIAFGKTGTIWDTDGARLLTTFDHSQGTTGIELVKFISPGLHQDLLLIRSKSCVSVRSPYGPYGSSKAFQGWSWSVPETQKGYEVMAVEFIESHECVAIAVYSAVDDRSRVILIDVNTGMGMAGTTKSSLTLIENIDGCISSLCAVGKERIKSNWDNASRSQSGKKKSLLTFYALTKSGDLILLTEDVSHYHSTVTKHAEPNEPTGPRLEVASSEDNGRKRQRTYSLSGPSSLSEELLRPKKLALDIFGFGTGNDSTLVPSTSELPSLSANFVKTLVGRNLRKSYQNDTVI
jgi:hypothetical protein